MMDGGWWMVGGGWWVTSMDDVTGWVVGHEKFSPLGHCCGNKLFVKAKRDFRKLAPGLRCASPTIFEEKKGLSPSFFVFPNFKIRFSADYFDKPNFGVCQGG